MGLQRIEHNLVTKCTHTHIYNDIWCWASFHMLICICISSLVRYLSRSCTHFNQQFLLLSFKSSLYMLDTSPFSDMSFTNIFLLACNLSFHSLDGIFHRAELLDFNEIQLIFFMNFVLVLCLKNSLPSPRSSSGK